MEYCWSTGLHFSLKSGLHVYSEKGDFTPKPQSNYQWAQGLSLQHLAEERGLILSVTKSSLCWSL